MKLSRLIVSGFSLLLLIGCQGGQPLKNAPSDPTSFMSLWNTYAHCQNTSEIDDLKKDAELLTSAASRSITRSGFVVPLPGKIERLVTTPSARFAVDIKAMAASCSLKASHVAINSQRFDVARTLLVSVLSYQEPDYAFYSSQARSLLASLDNPIIQVSLKVQ